jgi:lipid A 3-O-deacylase
MKFILTFPEIKSEGLELCEKTGVKSQESRMNIKFFLAFFLLPVFCLPFPAEALHNPWTHTFYFENDLFNGTDSNYTNGVKYSVISPDLSPGVKEGRLPRKVLEYIHRIPFIKESLPELTHQVEFSFGQNMFTPTDTARSDLVEDDRPYAGWLYISTSYHRKYDTDEIVKFMDTVEVQLGVIGPASLAEDTQRIVHKWREIPVPKGWDNQLKNEPGIAAVFERKWLFHPVGPKMSALGAIAHAGGALGNVYTYLNTGLEIRMGWNLPKDFGVSLIRPAGSTRLSIGKDFALFGFGAVNGRLVIRDIFLDGNTFRDSHSVDKEPFVADLAAGIAMQFGNVMLTWTEVMRTREFRGQGTSHSFGAIALSFSYPFDFRR